MENPVSRSDAKHLQNQHRQWLTVLEQLSAARTDGISQVVSSAHRFRHETTQELLNDISVEELSRSKSGIKIKTLKDNGYHTLSDILASSVQALADIDGISDESAAVIQQLACDYANTLQDTVKIRLSSDIQTDASTALIAAIAHYRYRISQWEAGCALLEQYGNSIRSNLQALTPATGFFSRLFSSGEKKQQAAASFAVLSDLASGPYGQQVSALNSIPAEPNWDSHTAWAEFSKNPIAFTGVLEELVPELLADTDSSFGLPQELADEVAAQAPTLKGLTCTLRHYQLWGVKYILTRKKVLLGDEMGLGKTVQAIAAMTALRNQGGTHFLVICPASVLTNWCREIQKFSDLPVIKIHGLERLSQWEQWLHEGGVGVTTYETTGYLKPEEAFRYTMLVVDEAHYIKNPQAQRTKNTVALSRHADHLLFMTGTALENRVDEMLFLLAILDSTIAEKAKSMAFLASAPQFREIVAPVYCRRKREDVLTELPELIDTKQWCTLSREEEARYEQAILTQQFSDARRVSWNMDDVKKSSKAARLQELVEEAEDDGRKVLVFSFFLDTLSKVCTLLGERCMPAITGAVSPERRQEIIDQFDQAPAGSVLVAQIQSGGVGLNIQSASVVIFCEPQLKPSSENQAISRAYRMGQSRNVLVYRLLADETIDERMVDLLEQKQAQFDAFADESAAAQQLLELDDAALGSLLEQEAQRIQEKQP